MRRARRLLPRVLPAASPPPNSAHEIHARHTQPRASLACSRLFISLARTLRQGSGRTTQEDKSVPPLEPYFTPSGHNTFERSSCPRIEQLCTSDRMWLTLSLPRSSLRTDLRRLHVARRRVSSNLLATATQWQPLTRFPVGLERVGITSHRLAAAFSPPGTPQSRQTTNRRFQTPASHRSALKRERDADKRARVL